MNTSEKIDELAAALATAQHAMVNPEKTKSASIKSDKGSYAYKYTDLADALDGLRKTLGSHGLSFIQVTQLDGETVTVLTRLLHSSGQWVEGVYPVCRTGAHQQMGAALSYARRYALFAMVGIAGDDDTDGSGAADAVGGSRRPVPVKPATPVEQSTDDLVLLMLTAIDAMDDIAKLNDWTKRHKAAFGRLSGDQQAHVRERADNRRGFLMQAPPADTVDADTGEISGAQDDGDAPADYDSWLSKMATALKAAADSNERAEIWDTRIAPKIDDGSIFPPDADRLKRLLEAAVP